MLVRYPKSTAKSAKPLNVFLVIEKIAKNAKYAKNKAVRIALRKTAVENAIETK